ncbi:hypothetical protein Tcan_09820 [Toxocara canis]|uniref:Uncharacterized protein n=1 Tax=Toxocara canis TaxID=6265 RepID=A0A0B2VGW0_TOXCA|nr:hypothetical protein Tcan_09820 [Toxocara canis]
MEPNSSGKQGRQSHEISNRFDTTQITMNNSTRNIGTYTQREENDVVTDKTISEKSEEETTAGLNEASADSAAYNEPGFNTCPSMTAKSWNDQQRKNCLLDAMM